MEKGITGMGGSMATYKRQGHGAAGGGSRTTPTRTYCSDKEPMEFTSVCHQEEECEIEITACFTTNQRSD